MVDSSMIDGAYTSIDGRPHKWYAGYSARGAYEGYKPILRPIITSSMGRVRPKLRILLQAGYPEGLDSRVYMHYQLHAVGYSTQPERIELEMFRRA